MYFTKLLITLCFIGCCLFSKAQSPVNYPFNPPTAGKDVTVTYNNKRTNLSDEPTIKGIVYLWKDYQWIAEDLKLSKNDTAWIATFSIPEDVALLTYRFYGENDQDAGGNQTYGYFVLNDEGMALPSSYIGWGMLRNETFLTLPHVIDTSARIADDVMFFWIQQELKNFPDQRLVVAPYGAKLLNKIKPGEYNSRFAEDIDLILELEEVGEELLLQILDVSKNILQDEERTQKIEERILADYTNGIMARDAEIWRIFRLENLEEKINDFKAFIERFPPAKFDGVNTMNTGLYYGKLFQSVIYAGIVNNNDYSLLYEYLNTAPITMLPTFYWHIVQIPLRNQERTAEQLLSFAEAIYNEVMTRKKSKEFSMLSDNEWNEKLLRDYKDMQLSHAEILSGNGRKDEALNILENVKPYYGYSRTDFNSVYVDLLAANGYDAMVIPTIIESVEEDAVNPEMIEILKKDYIAKNGNDKEFDAYFSSLKSADKLEEMYEHLRNSLIKENIDLFALESMNGGKVDMSKLKGKILVLDFWATWCAPCKAAFPGMQMAVNKYSNDPNVEFFFISTMETKADYKEHIKKFMDEKNFDLHVLYDNDKANSVYDAYAKTFRFSGIPHKMIIDGDGYLRWSSGGYHGSPSGLAEELTFLIETIKAEK